jgi:hypothetical protein
MRYAKQHLTYSNVVSSVALFLVLSSGMAYAATKVGTRDIKAGAVKTKQLARNSVTRAKIAPGAVRAGKIAPGAVGSTQLAPGAVGTEELGAGIIGAAQLAPNSVDGSKVVDGSITGNDLAPGVIPGPGPGVPANLSATTAAMATGGPVKVPTGSEQEEEEKEEEEGEEGEESEEPTAAPIPLTPSQWTQGPEDNLIYLAQVEATLQPEEEAECGIEVEVSVDGQSMGTIPAIIPEQEGEEGEEEEGEEGEEEVPSPPQSVTSGRVLGPTLMTGTAQTRTLTASAMIGEDAACESARVDSLKILVLSIG